MMYNFGGASVTLCTFICAHRKVNTIKIGYIFLNVYNSNDILEVGFIADFR